MFLLCVCVCVCVCVVTMLSTLIRPLHLLQGWYTWMSGMVSFATIPDWILYESLKNISLHNYVLHEIFLKWPVKWFARRMANKPVTYQQWGQLQWNCRQLNGLLTKFVFPEAWHFCPKFRTVDGFVLLASTVSEQNQFCCGHNTANMDKAVQHG